MKRWAIGLLLVGCATAVLASYGGSADAGEFLDRLKRERAQYPPRYTRGSMAQWYVYRDRNGKIKYRETYPGYESHFPPPAYLYYGYPKSGYFTGLGIGGSP